MTLAAADRQVDPGAARPGHPSPRALREHLPDAARASTAYPAYPAVRPPDPRAGHCQPKADHARDSAPHDAGRRRTVPVVEKDVREAVRIAADQIRGVRLEDHDPAVRAERRPQAVAVRLDPASRDAHPLLGTALPVVDEDVGCAVRIPGNEIRGFRVEGDIPPVGAQRWPNARAVSLSSA